MISLLASAAVVCQLLPVSRSGHGIPDDPFHFRVGTGKTVEQIDGNGKGASAGDPRRSFTLPVENASIETLFAASCGSVRIYLYELSDEEEGWSVAVGVDPGGRIKYRAAVGGFNLARPAVEGHFAYLATIDSVSKLDLVTGRIPWSHRGLYQQDHAFNIFDEPVVGQQDVVFRASQAPGGVVKELVIDKISGEIREGASGH